MMKNVRFLSTICISLLLILSIIQIFPGDVKIIRVASASSTWEDTNWSASNNYSKIQDLEQINSTGDIKLLWGQWLFISDTFNNRIVRTTISGSGWATYGTWGSGTGQLRYPHGIYYDMDSDYIYIADSDNHRIVKTKFDGSGWTTTAPGQFYYPSDIYYDSDTGFIYVADTWNFRIVKTKINGSGWTTYGTRGSGKGQFDSTTGIYYDKTTEFVYVTDYLNNRIVKTKMNGSGWTTYGTQGSGKGQFYYPNQIDYDNTNGFLYIADQYNSRIVKTMMNGTGWTSYGSLGTGKGQFNYPIGMHYNNDTDYIYITDSRNHRIVKTLIDGSDWSTMGTQGNGKKQLSYPCDVTLGGFHLCQDGFLESKQFNSSSPANLQTISWVADTPQDTYVKFQLRSAPNQSALVNKSFVGPQGSTSTYYNKSGANIWQGHDGDQWFQYKVYLNTSNVSRTPILKDVKIVYNLLPNQPTLISPHDNAWTNDRTPTLSWEQNDTDSSAQSAFQWQADNDPEFNHIDYDSNIINSLQSSHTLTALLPVGFWYWRVRTKDNDGGWGPYSEPWKIQIETTPPTSKVTIPLNNSFHNKLEIIAGTAFDPETSAGINNVEIAIIRLDDDKYWDGTTWISKEAWLITNGTTIWNYSSNSIDWTSGYQYRIYSRGIDNATNIEIPGEGNIFTFDTDNPISTIEIPMDNSAYNNLDFISGSSTDADCAGVKKVEILIKRLSDDHCWDGFTWDLSETWLKTFGTNEWIFNLNSMIWTTKKQYIIYSRATDNVNNVEIPTDGTRLFFDTDKPSSTIKYPSNNSCVNNLDIITGSAADFDGSGIDTVEITIKPAGKSSYWSGNSWNPDICWLTVEGKDNWSYDTHQIQWTTDTYYTIRSRATDNADNRQTLGVGTTFMYDDKTPEQSFSINENAEFTNSEAVELSLEYDDSGSGVALMAFSNDNIEWSDWELINTTKTYNLSQSDGDKTLYFRVQDKAGNIAEPVTNSIILDSQPPECTIVINDDAEYTNTNIVSLSLTASDSLSEVSVMAFSFNSNTWTSWEPFNIFRSITLPNPDGENTVYLRVQDLVGNTAISMDIITLDTTPPHSLSILINDGATETNSTTVILKLSALDATSGVNQMSFSEDGITWSPWEDYTETKSYDLLAGSNKTVIYFRVTDRVGNVAHPEVGSITLNNQRSEIKSDSTDTDMFWLIILGIIIVIVIAMSVAIILYKRKKRAKETMSVQESAIITHGDLSAPAITTPHLVPVQTPAQPELQVTTTLTTPTPQIAQVQSLPQLPPAIIRAEVPTPTATLQDQQLPQDQSEKSLEVPQQVITISETPTNPTPEPRIEPATESDQEQIQSKDSSQVKKEED